MSANTAMTSVSPKRQFRTSSTQWGKNTGTLLTSEMIAADIAAFKKKGGRIKVLGNTPIRASDSTFRANTAATQRKKPAAQAAPST